MHSLSTKPNEIRYRIKNTMPHFASTPTVSKQQLDEIPVELYCKTSAILVDYKFGTSKRTGNKKVDLIVLISDILDLPDTYHNYKIKAVEQQLSTLKEGTHTYNSYEQLLASLKA